MTRKENPIMARVLKELKYDLKNTTIDYQNSLENGYFGRDNRTLEVMRRAIQVVESQWLTFPTGKNVLKALTDGWANMTATYRVFEYSDSLVNVLARAEIMRLTVRFTNLSK